jgi:hypothetical protein
MRSSDYIAWSVKALYYVGGVASTVVGSLLSSKIRVYHDARNSHRDELQKKVLEPLRRSLELYGIPQFTVLYQAQQYNAQASAGQSPSTYGPQVVLERPSQQPSLDQALLEDARLHHYADAITAVDAFVKGWSAEAERHRVFVEATSQELLSASLLPAFPSPNPGPYIMHWNLGVFVYSRLVLKEDVRLWTQPQPDGQVPDCHVLSDGHVTVAKGSLSQMKNIVSWVDAELIAKRERANAFSAALKVLEAKRAALNRQLSLAIAEKKLKHQCALVKFI